MARVKVRSFTVVRDAIGSPLVEIEVVPLETVRGVLGTLLKLYGGKLRETICDPNTGQFAPFPIRLNEEIIFSTFDIDRPVKDGDEIAIIFPIGGG